jgi:hypothetical protein
MMKWASPFALGRFDFFTTIPPDIQWNTLFNAMPLSLGRYWVRVSGGANLRRLSDGNIPQLSTPLCGAANGDAATIFDHSTIVSHPVNSRYCYGITAVGSGGVEEPYLSGIREVVFGGAGTWVGATPNPALGPTVTANIDGSFTISWRYDPNGQQVAPETFRLYRSVKNSAAIDYGSVVASVSYVPGQTEYTYTTAVIADPTPGLYYFAVRSRSSGGAEEKNTSKARAFNCTDAPYDTIKTVGDHSLSVASPGPK